MTKETLNRVRAPDVTSNPGLAVDAGGNPVIDPTKNVLDLVTASERRMDDLAVAAEKLSSVKHEHSRELIKLHAGYEEKLRVAEANRLDAIRAVDVAAAGIREERVTASATVLANQVSASAEALRALVATTAAATSTATAATFTQLTDRIAVLEKGSYEGSGKAAVADPMMARMVDALDALRANMAKGQGGVETRQESRASIGMIVGLGVGALSFLTFIVLAANFLSAR